MDCERVRDQVLTALSTGESPPRAEPVTRHLEGCQDCRAEIDALSQTWALLGRWPPEAPPGEAIKARLVRRVRRQLVRESVLTVSGWVPAALAAVVGVGLSVGLSLLLPYAALVSWCRDALQVAEPHAAPYLLAGMAYGIPLAIGVFILRQRARSGALVGGLEASVLFLAILTPYVMTQCREFPPALQLAFVSGLGGGAVVSSLAGSGLARLVPVSRME
ncbi:MAG: hypothetical protein HY002_11940 [Candidatus Rokubacteria bacterium]|nr:hypothetical protein [Candidatus Rokubacteria bacterium]